MLIIDEAKGAFTTVLCELRILASKELDSKQLLCVVFAGDARLPELLHLGSRIRRRLAIDWASRWTQANNDVVADEQFIARLSSL